MKPNLAVALLGEANPVQEEITAQWALSGAANDVYLRIIAQPCARPAEAAGGGRRKLILATAATVLATAAGIGLTLIGHPDGTDKTASTSPASVVASSPTSQTQPSIPVSPEHGLTVVGMNYLSAQVRDAQVIVWGRIHKVEKPRWNSPDGGEWRGQTEADLPIVYTTYVVEPVEFWKGPEGVESIRLMVPGGIAADGASTRSDEGLLGAGLAVGDEIVALAGSKPQYGPTGEDSFWLLHGGSSVFRRKGGLFERLEPVTGDPSGNMFTLEELRGLVRSIP